MEKSLISLGTIDHTKQAKLLRNLVSVWRACKDYGPFCQGKHQHGWKLNLHILLWISIDYRYPPRYCISISTKILYICPRYLPWYCTLVHDVLHIDIAHLPKIFTMHGIAHLPKISTTVLHICPRYPPLYCTFAQDIHHCIAHLPKISTIVLHICPRYPPLYCTFAQDIHHCIAHLPKISTWRYKITCSHTIYREAISSYCTFRPNMYKYISVCWTCGLQPTRFSFLNFPIKLLLSKKRGNFRFIYRKMPSER